MLQLQIRTLAKEDIQQIVDYYEDISTQVTDNFLIDLYADLELLQGNPQIFQVKYRQTHVRYMKRFPFGIHYQFDTEKVVILAVLHTSKNPKVWESR